MYYEDLSLYAYIIREAAPNVLNVGWLEASHPYPKGEVSEEFLDRLFELCQSPVNRTRGWQECQFCEKASFGVRVVRGDRELVLGSAEIRVAGEGGVIYAAPNMIYHYVADHGYRPPDAFIEAVMK
jgi:hypothetical protein